MIVVVVAVINIHMFYACNPSIIILCNFMHAQFVVFSVCARASQRPNKICLHITANM